MPVVPDQASGVGPPANQDRRETVAETAKEATPPAGIAMTPLDEAAARTALIEACTAVGLDPQGAELIRLGSNGVFRLRTRPVVARVARSSAQLAATERQLAVSRWLASEDVPAIHALDVAQPVIADGRVVTFWESAADDARYGTTRDLGRILRRLHGLKPPADLRLPPLAPFGPARSRIERVSLEAADREFLRRRCDDLEDAYGQLRFELPAAVLHGDANVGNLILDSRGRALLSDLDGFCVGPGEWDLVLTGMFYERFGWHTREEYADFVRAYGRDVTEWDGFAVLSDVRELLMVAWLAQNTHNADAAAELAKRLESIRRGRSRRDWSPF
jgi:aminoglycoside phosphotransferase (APT) family kinase protein